MLQLRNFTTLPIPPQLRMRNRRPQPLNNRFQITNNPGYNHIIPKHNISTSIIIHLITINNPRNLNPIIFSSTTGQKLYHVGIFMFEYVYGCELV